MQTPNQMSFDKKYPALLNQKQVLLQQNNAKPHTARQTQKKIKNLESIKLFLDTANSTDLALFYYHLLRYMTHFLHDRKFFAFNSKDWYRSRIKQLVDR